MSSSVTTNADILAKLKIKNIPVSKQQLDIIIPAKQPMVREAIELKTKIVDKTKFVEFDRESFLKNITGTADINGPAPAVVIAGPADKIKPKKKIVIEEEMTEPAALAEPAALVEPAALAELVEPAALAELVEPAALAELVEPAAPVGKKSSTLVKKKPTGKEPTVLVEEGEEVVMTRIIKRKPKPPTIGVILEGPASMLQIGNTDINSRVKEKAPSVLVSASAYYMNNREIFTNFMYSLFGKYTNELVKESKGATCDYDPNAPFSLMTHQKIVRDYLNLYTPYRGLLLFHGLGSGKTCSSIAIAEGMKSGKRIIVMTPASLRMNFIEELKKCGDELYHKNQFWEFIDTKVEPELTETLSRVLALSVEFIRKAGGAWMVNMQKPSNFDKLDSGAKKSLNIQLNEMISNKYTFMNYNGMRKSHLAVLTQSGKINPFDNTVVIIDEAHNFVSRIVNKLGKSDTLSGALYEYLMTAQNVKIVLLTGTPIINYPNEIAILFNILRGKIKTWSLKLAVNSEMKVSQEYLQSLFKSTLLGGNIMDFLEYKPTSTTLIITRNPFSFVNKTKAEAYEGVRVGERGDIDDAQFLKYVTSILLKNGIKVIPGSVKVDNYKALPDKMDDFKAYFINDKTKEVKNMDLFKRRILGLSSYFRSAQESLMPKYMKSQDFHVVKIPMSDFQFSVYEEARIEERKLEKRNASKKGKKAKEGIYEESVSTYRIFSRAFCNFVFPRPDIRRPMPKDGDLASTISAGIDEDELDDLTNEEKLDNIDGRYDADDLLEEEGTGKDKGVYDKNIRDALRRLSENKERYLSPLALETYSPKFLRILENIQNIDHEGLHLVYSQFRTLEGIGILKLVLEANGFVQFKIKKMGETWQLDMTEAELANPNRFALYTGTESAEEKEIIRNIYNGDWKYIPQAIEAKLKLMGINNMYGEIIKVLMISASGAEGISLKNVRYVHITEPYWHPVRIEQVIGRARRICSHKDLPEALRTVSVFLYLMTFSKKQLESDLSIELRLQDKSKIDDKTAITSDEALYEIATIKENINSNILMAVKEASIDCVLHSKSGDSEKLKCFSFGSTTSGKFSYYPSIDEEELDNITAKNKVSVTWKAVPVTIEGVEYAYRKETQEVYDLKSYKLGQPIPVGKLTIIGDGDAAKYSFERI
jgi:hypothetical protein